MYSNNNGNNVEISVLEQDLPQNIVDRFFDVLLGLVEIEDLEQWIYNEARLEEYLHPDDYLDLISMDFQKARSSNYDAESIKHEFGYIVAKYIQNSEYTKAGDRVTRYKIKYLIPEYLDGSKFTIEDDLWLDFENFYEDVEECPERIMLDRIDNDKGYCKDNCRWADPVVQSNNRRSSSGTKLTDADVYTIF